MGLTTAAHLIDVLSEFRLLEEAQLEKLKRALAGRSPEPRALAAQLIKQGWLTPYQANLLLQGRTAELVLGPYILLERLGEGGMGQVYKARHQLMNRVVALKVIRKERLGSSDAVQRFHREIRAVAQLDHPHLVRAHDAASVGDVHFLVMEYAEGIDLGRLVQKQGPLPVGQACLYARQAAEGLQQAGDCGLVHRDIKPSNLQVVAGGKAVKILDLGLARSQEPDGGTGGELTQACTILGTPDYIAPEQIDDPRRVDIRADIYSLGCTLYFMLAGRPPFPDGPWEEKLSHHRKSEPQPIEQVRPDVPPALGAVLRKMMAKQPENRYATPAAVAAALAPFVEEVVLQPTTISVVAVPASTSSLLQPQSTPEAGWTLKVDSTVSPAATPTRSGKGNSSVVQRTVLEAPPPAASTPPPVALTPPPASLPAGPALPPPSSRGPGKGLWIALAAGNAVLLLAVLVVLLWPKGGDKGDRAEGGSGDKGRGNVTAGADDGGKAPEEASHPKTFYEGVDFEVVGSSREGKVWILVVAATSRAGDKKAYFVQSRAITPEGRTYSGSGTMSGPVRLPEGIKIQIPLNMGPIPATETKFVRVELMPPRFANLDPMALNDVSIDPSPGSPGNTPPRRTPGRGR